MNRRSSTWKDQTVYDAQATRLAEMFRKYFEQFKGAVTPEISQAGPGE